MSTSFVVEEDKIHLFSAENDPSSNRQNDDTGFSNDVEKSMIEGNKYSHCLKDSILCEDDLQITSPNYSKHNKGILYDEEENQLVRKGTLHTKSSYSIKHVKGLPLSGDILEEELTGSKYLEKVYTEVGYGKHQLLMIIITFLVISLEGIHLYITSALIQPFSQFYGLTEKKLEFLSSLMFVGVGVGSFSLSLLNKVLKRKTQLELFTILLITAHLFWTLTKGFVFICILRITIGLFLGILIPLTLSILVEYLPMKFRALTLTSVWLGFSFGQAVVITNIGLVMPEFQPAKTEEYLMSLIPYQLIVLTFIFIFMKDSPRNLFKIGKYEEGYKIIESMLSRRLTDDEKALLKSTKVPSKERSSYSTLYNSEYFGVSILTNIIGCFGSMLIFGPMLLSNMEITTQGIADEESSLGKMLLIVIISGSANPIGGLFTEIEYLGRRKSCALAAIIGALSSTVIIFYPQIKLIFTAGISFAAFLLVNVFSSYILEIFPTKYRDIAVSMYYTSMRLGGFTSQFIFTAMYFTSVILPFYVYTALFLLEVLLLFLLPYDTSGRPLD